MKHVLAVWNVGQESNRVMLRRGEDNRMLNQRNQVLFLKIFCQNIVKPARAIGSIGAWVKDKGLGSSDEN
jgi:hypothetical protein